MIKGSCHTNLDEYDYIRWPSVFAVVPSIGDRVESICRTKILKVVGITHGQGKTDEVELGGGMGGIASKVYPKIKVELHK